MCDLIDRIFPGYLQEVVAVVGEESATLAAGEFKLISITQADVPSFIRRDGIVAPLPEVPGQEWVYVFIKVELDLAHRCWGKRLAKGTHDKLALAHVKTKT